MPIVEADPWRAQYFTGVPCPDDVVIPTDDELVAHVEAIDLDLRHAVEKRFRMGGKDPLTAEAEVVQKTLFRLGSWQSRVETRTRITSTEDHFVLEAELRAYEDGKELFARTWEAGSSATCCEKG